MDWYGLGIALQFRDNATSGITRATQNLTNLSNSAKNMASTTTQALSDVEKVLDSIKSLYPNGKYKLISAFPCTYYLYHNRT